MGTYTYYIAFVDGEIVIDLARGTIAVANVDVTMCEHEGKLHHPRGEYRVMNPTKVL